MKNNTKFFIGIDVSKPFFDAALLVVVNHMKNEIVTGHFLNTQAGIKEFEKWLKTHKVSFDSNTILVIENTGVYQRQLWAFCSKVNLHIHIGNAAHIKWSFGIARGKNDKIDAERLCKYAFKEAEELVVSPALNPVLMQLKDLQTSRNRFLSQKNGNETYLKELKDSNSSSTQKQMEQVYKTAIEGLKKSILAIEAMIKKIIMADESLKKNYNLLLTIPGIGNVTAVYLLVCTNNFAGNISGKQLACYAGVAPFANTSGISIKGKEKVHKMANKELKKLLFMCAMATLQYSPEMKQYYDRKTAEGKHGFSVLNAIKNKILLRVASVIKNQKPYVDNYKPFVDNLKKAS